MHPKLMKNKPKDMLL